MEEVLSIIQKNREYILTITANLTTAEYNYIPQNNNNNVIWNMTHILSIQQLILYGLTGQTYTLDEPYLMPYKNKTVPQGDVNKEFIDQVRILMDMESETLKQRYKEGLLQNVVTPFRSRLGIEFDTIEGLLTFNMYHECLHMSVITQYLKEIDSRR